MSVFKKLKGTFRHAQQDFVVGLRALTTLDSHSRNEALQNFKAREVNLDTGADLLQCYQKNWSAIQTETQESAKIAETASALLTPLFKTWENHAESVRHLEQEVKTIPSILTTLTQLHTLLDSLSQGFIKVERELDILESICDEQEFYQRCREEQKKLALYKVKKEGETERVKVELAQSHAKKMIDLEAVKRKSLQERADAFTTAFQNDLEFYRTHGHPGKIPAELPKVTSLSEIILDDQDNQALDSFLGPDAETEGSTGSFELSGDGSYIEDDYTNDFSVKRDTDFQEDSNHQASLAATISTFSISDDNDADNGDTETDPQNTSMASGSALSSEHNYQELSQDAGGGKTDDLESSKVNHSSPKDIDGNDLKEILEIRSNETEFVESSKVHNSTPKDIEGNDHTEDLERSGNGSENVAVHAQSLAVNLT